MSDPRREITLSVSTTVLMICLTTAQCVMQRDIHRIAGTLDAHLCIEVVKAGGDRREMPEACHRNAKGTDDDE